MQTTKVSNTQICIAYALLCLLLLMAWRLVAAPILTSWNNHESRTSVIQASLSKVIEQQQQEQNDKTALSSTITNLLSLGQLSKQTTTAGLNHETQESLKKALNASNAKLVQIRPKPTNNSEWLLGTNMEISFQVQPSQLGKLISEVEQSLPQLSVDLLAITRPFNWNTNTGRPNNRILEANMSVRSASPSTRLLSALEIDPQTIYVNKLESGIEPQNVVLSGLFDRQMRARLKTPGPQHYRLSAITRSPEGSVAILIDKLNSSTKRLKEGESLEGWRVNSITEQAISFSLGSENYSLELR